MLAAALSVFAEKGFSAARMDEIAARASVSKGTLYLYFESKEGMFKALLRETITTRISELAAIIEKHEGPTPALLAAAMRNFGAFASQSDRVVLPKIVISEAGNFPDLARFYREEVIERAIKLLGGIITRGIERGEIRDVPVQHAVRLLVAPFLVVMLWRTVFARFDTAPYDYPGLIETHIATVLKGLAP
ncbi:MAG: TetR/AcrR family transcriptional regulator [Alphaproteobacteria bacterium]